MNLWDLNENETAHIDAFSSGNEHIRSKLKAFGLKEGASVECLCKTVFNGPRIYNINGRLCSICQTGAKKVIVTARS